LETDVRDIPNLSSRDISNLNFIRDPGRYVFRRHYRQGLRSHVMEVLHPDDVVREKKGIVTDGIRWFPRANPCRRAGCTGVRSLPPGAASARSLQW
jgi:hypothetical protein